MIFVRRCYFELAQGGCWTVSKNRDREEIVAKINNAAVLYKNNLVGRKFLYVFENRYIEVIYKSENFRHLTGVDTMLSAKAFYNYARCI